MYGVSIETSRQSKMKIINFVEESDD